MQTKMTPIRENGWLQMKTFRQFESLRLHLSESRIAQKIKRGEYPALQIKRVNSRVVWVKEKA